MTSTPMTTAATAATATSAHRAERADRTAPPPPSPPAPPTAPSPVVDPGLLERLDAQLRDAVRREGIDPQTDGRVVRRLAEGVVRAHDDLSLTGQVVPLGDPIGLVARVAGFGAFQVYLDDPEVEESRPFPHRVNCSCLADLTLFGPKHRPSRVHQPA